MTRSEVGGGSRSKLGGWTPRLIVATVLLSAVLEALSLGASMVSIGLPQILQEFPTTQGGWLTTVYFLVGAICAPILGKTADLYGKRRVLLVTMFISGIGALVCALAPNFGVLLLGRILQGPILATLTLIPSLIRDVYPPRQAAFAASITVTGMGAFSLAAPTVIGWLLATYGFRGMFVFDAVWTLALCVGVALTLPESSICRHARPDILGGVLLTGAVLPVLLYASMGRTWGWMASLPLLALGVAICFLFVRHARSADEPLINLALFKRRPLVFVAFGGAITYAITASTFQLIPLLAMTSSADGGTYGLGLSTIEYSAIATPKQLATVLGGVVIGYLLARGRNPRVFLTIGIGVLGIAHAAMALAHSSFGAVLFASLLVGLGGGISNAAIPNLVMRSTPADDQGSTAGTVQLCTSGASSILPVVMFAVLAPYMATSSSGGVFYENQGITIWLWITAGICAVGLIVGATLLREKKGEAIEEFSVDGPSPADLAGAQSTDQPPVWSSGQQPAADSI